MIKNRVRHLTKILLTLSLKNMAHHSQVSPRPPIRKPQHPPRESSLPQKDLELIKQVTLSKEALQDVVQDLKKSEPQKYKGYIKKLKEKKPKQQESD